MSITSPYVMAPVRRAHVAVLGYIWLPNNVPCAQTIELSDYDLKNIGRFTRANVADWLSTHAGDFSHILDFEARCGKKYIKWASEDNEATYISCIYGDES